MLLLTSINDIIRIVTGTTGSSIQVHASYVDNNAGTITPDRKNTAPITTNTTTTVVAAPSGSVQRNVKSLSIHNSHASVGTQVTVQHYDGTNSVDLESVMLLAGEALHMDISGKWRHLDANGGEYSAVTKLDVVKRVTADSVHATAATWATVTGLTVDVKAGKTYAFDAVLFHINNATTTGSQFGIGGVAMTSMIAGAISTVANSATAATMSTGVVTAVDTAAVVQTTGPAANAPTYMSGTFTPSADGTFAVRATSEVTVANGLIVKAGSWVWVREVDN